LAEEAAVDAAAVEARAHGAGGWNLYGLEEAARTLEERDATLFRFGAMHEPATLLLQMFRFEKENVEGEDLAGLARATRDLHEELAARARLLASLLDAPPVRAEERSDHASCT